MVLRAQARTRPILRMSMLKSMTDEMARENADYGDDLDKRWEDIVAELSDIVDPGEPFALDGFEGEPSEELALNGFEEPEVVADLHMGPRDWRAPDDEDPDFEDGLDVVELGTLMPIDDDVPHGHPLSKLLWVATAALLVMGVLAAFDVAPGGTALAFAWGAAGFVCAGTAAFLASPRSEDTDPFDDGARL